MGFGNFFGSSSRPREDRRPPLGPGSSKADYAYGLNSPGTSTSTSAIPSYYSGDGDDAPPPYCPQDDDDTRATDYKGPTPQKIRPDPVHSPTSGGTHKPTEFNETALVALKKYDLVVVLDDSGSMMTADNPYGKTRWDQAWDALEKLVDVGGERVGGEIRIHFLNNQKYDKTVKTARDVRDLRKDVRVPREDTHTPTGDVLDTLLVEYMRQTGSTPGRAGVLKRYFIIITDGAATDAPEDAIVRAGKFFQEHQFPLDQVGIQFLQVGNDREASKFLEDLDTDLVKQMGKYARDMVDTVRPRGVCLEKDTLIKTLTGGFNRKQDRMGER